jgi:hypothetical protein
VYFGVDPNSQWPPSHFVYPAHVLLQRPSGLGLPEPGDRYGRAASGIQFLRVAEGSEPEVLPGLLVAEPDAATSQGFKTGQVTLYRPPLCSIAPPSVCLDLLDPCLTLQPVDAPNAWSTGPLLQPTVPFQPNEYNAVVEEEQLFGSDIVALDYKGNQILYPGQQFVVSSRLGKVVLVARVASWSSHHENFAISASPVTVKSSMTPRSCVSSP